MSTGHNIRHTSVLIGQQFLELTWVWKQEEVTHSEASWISVFGEPPPSHWLTQWPYMVAKGCCMGAVYLMKCLLHVMFVFQMTLGHEFGAGASCLKCKDKCEGFELHFWRWDLHQGWPRLSFVIVNHAPTFCSLVFICGCSGSFYWCLSDSSTEQKALLNPTHGLTQWLTARFRQIPSVWVWTGIGGSET